MKESKHGILTIEDEPIFQIIRQYKATDNVESTARVCMISEESVQEAIEFYREYPHEVYRDIVKRQLYHFRAKIHKRREALDLFLNDCDDCEEGEYKWREGNVSKENLLSARLYKLTCPNCGHEPN